MPYVLCKSSELRPLPSRHLIIEVSSRNQGIFVFFTRRKWIACANFIRIL